MHPLRRIDEHALARTELRKRPAPKPAVLKPSSKMARSEIYRLSVEADTMGVHVHAIRRIADGEYSLTVFDEASGDVLTTTVCCWSDEDD